MGIIYLTKNKQIPLKQISYIKDTDGKSTLVNFRIDRFNKDILLQSLNVEGKYNVFVIPHNETIKLIKEEFIKIGVVWNPKLIIINEETIDTKGEYIKDYFDLRNIHITRLLKTAYSYECIDTNDTSFKCALLKLIHIKAIKQGYLKE